MSSRPLSEIKAERMADYDRMGEEHVRLMLEQGRWTGSKQAWAIEWLAKKDQEARLRNDASSSEQMRITRSAKNAAWAAAMAAIVAAIAAIAAVLISLAPK